VELRAQVKDLTKELMLLKNNPHLKNPSPKIKSHRNQIITDMTDIRCQAKDKSAMEIEPRASSPRRMVRCTSLRKKIFYTKVYVKIHVKREVMEIEKEKIAHHPKSKQKIPEKTQKFVKVFVRKDGMEIENQKDQENKSPPKRVPDKKKKHLGTPKELAPRKKRPKRNTPKKASDGSELKVNKILTQPAKMTLMTDFFNTLTKSQGCAIIKTAPDPT